MRHLATTSLVLLGVALWSVATPRDVSAQTLLFDYVGFDYEAPDPVPGTFGEVGSGYVGLGVVPGLFAPLVADTATYEYTYVMSGLSSVLVTPIAGSYVLVTYSPGVLRIYEDSKALGTAAVYTANPPNLEVPSYFTDGTLFLQATLSNFQFIVNTTNGTGSFEAAMQITGGSQLSNFPLNQRQGWTFAGSTGNALNIPPGWYHQIDGQAFLNEPVPTRSTTWGRLKAHYR